MAGTPWLGCRGWINGISCGVASLGIAWMQRYFLLSGTGYSSHIRSSRSAVRRGSLLSSESVSALDKDVLSKVRCQQIPSQNGRLLGHIGVEAEIGHCVMVKSARSKEASVVNMEYMQIGLVIWGGGP